MKFSRRARLISGASLLVIATATTGVIMAQPDNEKKDKSNKPALAAENDPSVRQLTPVQPEQEAAEAPTAPTSTTSQQTTTTTTNTAPVAASNSVYGEDPDKPGWFKVFDPDKFLEMNGTVPMADREAAKQVVEKLSGWYYNKPGATESDIVLCGMKGPQGTTPVDYRNDPVSYFGRCHRKALSMGGWQAWLNSL